MNVLLLYLVLLKATATTFSGLASLPTVRQELVLHRHVLTDKQLNTAVVMTRSTPGPVGLSVVSVGYFAGGVPGAVAGWLAMCSPAVVIVFLRSRCQRQPAFCVRDSTWAGVAH
jgi:chromate transporter